MGVLIRQALREQMETLFDPLLSVFERMPRLPVFTTEKRTADTTLDAVVVAGRAGSNQVRTRGCHGS